MAKSTAHLDKLGSFDTFKAPWESEAGADAEVDKPVLKKLVYNLKTDLAKAKDAVDDAKVALTEAETARDEALATASDGTGAEAQKQIDKLTKDLAAANAKVESFETAAAQAELRKEVLGDFEAQNPKAAKYVTGTTKEELEASLAEVKEDWGITDSDEEGEEEEDEVVVRTRPKSLLVNAADKANGKGADKEYDFDAVANDALYGQGVFH